MIRFIFKRLAWSVFVVLLVLTIVFNILFGVGDPASATLGQKAGPEQLEIFRQKYGLDEPIYKQFLSYLGLIPCVRRSALEWHEDPSKREHCGLLQGNMADSLQQNEPVASVMGTRLPRTLLLGIMAMVIELWIGLTIGIVAAVKRHTWLDTGLMMLTFLGISAPTFLTGLWFLNTLAFRLGWFPVGGYGVSFWDHVYHGFLPALALAIIGASTYARIMRTELIDVLKSDFIRTAKAKGLHPLRVLFVHGVRNAILPIVTLLGLQMSTLVSGAVITESIFAWPGIGRLAIESIYNLDAFTVMGVVLMASFAVQIGNLLADIAMYKLDPRIRLQ